MIQDSRRIRIATFFLMAIFAWVAHPLIHSHLHGHSFLELEQFGSEEHHNVALDHSEQGPCDYCEVLFGSDSEITVEEVLVDANSIEDEIESSFTFRPDRRLLSSTRLRGPPFAI